MLDQSLDGVRIAWLLPRIEPGSGGQQTVFRHVSYLQKLGAECHVLTCQFGIADNAREMSKMLSESYQCTPDKVFDVAYSDESYDLAVATMNTTVPYLFELNARERAYFVQDYEPYFYPVDGQYIDAVNTYRDDLTAITIGRWLVHKLTSEHGLKAKHTEFTADRSIYHSLGLPRKKAVCAVFQPTKPRRCYSLVIKTLELVHTIDPDVQIILYGQDVDYPLSFPAERRGLISKEDCNKLYNECMVGLCISATNPSRVPFEMMAAGLPVVDIYGDNMLWDFPPESAVLAKPTPESLATALLSVLEDEDRAKRASEAGYAFMERRDSEVEQVGMAEIVKEIIGGADGWSGDSVSQMYDSGPVVAPPEIADVFSLLNRRYLSDAITPPAVDCASRYVRVGVRGLPEGSSPLDVYLLVHFDSSSEFKMLRYNVRGIEDDEFWMQIDFNDFGRKPGLYHCRVFSDLPEMVISPCLTEWTLRFVAEGEGASGLEPGQVTVSQRKGYALSFEASEAPYAFSVKSMLKDVLPDSAVAGLRTLLDRVR